MTIHICDVREDLRNGQEPFSKIMAMVAALQSEDVLELIAPFQPAPLYKVLAKQGFAHVAEQLTDGDWKITFSRNQAL